MADIVDKTTRSRMMGGIKGKNTKPELLLRHALHALGFRFRLHAKALPGRPDIVFPKHQAVVQVQGCFWHRHEKCAFATTPSSNVKFWAQKFGENQKRDSRNLKALLALGWRVAVVWECSIKEQGETVVARRVSSWLVSRRSFAEFPLRRR